MVLHSTRHGAASADSRKRIRFAISLPNLRTWNYWSFKGWHGHEFYFPLQCAIPNNSLVHIFIWPNSFKQTKAKHWRKFIYRDNWVKLQCYKYCFIWRNWRRRALLCWLQNAEIFAVTVWRFVIWKTTAFGIQKYVSSYALPIPKQVQYYNHTSQCRYFEFFGWHPLTVLSHQPRNLLIYKTQFPVSFP